MFEPGRYLAVNIFTEVLEVYDMVTGELLASLEVLPTMIRFDPTGRYLASGTLDGRVVVLDLAARVGGTAVEDALVMDATVATGGVPGIALTADGVLATSAFDSPFIRLWDIHTGGLLAELRTGLDGSSPPQLNFSPDGSYLLYPDAGNVLRKFSLNTDHLVDLARTRVTRPLSEDECRRFLDPVTCD
jgi:WD40 repeat protein